MKNQIQQISEQAKKAVPHGLTPDKWIEVYNEKFAKLIVRECADEISKVGSKDLALYLKFHFGVEE